ncbi:MAG: asparagine synthase (glutamine-hydrolyzing) [Candidatus Roizmanbacteria bacterium]
MCGIGGYFGFQDDELVKKMSQMMQHRGPDGEGIFSEGYVTLLNRRLAIIDRAGGDQPIYNEDKSIVVVYNGEIYNYREIRDELEKKGHVFSTHSDTEILVHGYEEWGDDSFDRYNGMFGVALYDKKNDRLVLARDHFGIKPVYYSSFKKNSKLQVLFASEIKPILSSGYIQKIPNDRIIYRYLKYRIHDNEEETFFKDIYRLMPGELLVIESNTLTKRKYTHLETEIVKSKKSPLTQEAIEQFGTLLMNAVKARLISEVPVGSCLSGGLDSSIVVALVNTLLKEKVEESTSVGEIQNVFSAVFPGSTNDEEKYIDAVVQKVQHIKNHKIYPKPEEFFIEMKDFIRTQEEPTISTGPYAQYKVMQEAHKHVTVVLDGQGSDEMMAGYLPYYFVYLKQLIKDKKWLLLFSECFASRDVLIKFGLHILVRRLGLKKSIIVETVLNKSFISIHKHEKFSVVSNNLKKRLAQDIFHNSLQSLLRYEDKNSMRFSIEGRVPFLDLQLIKFIFSLSDEAIIKNGWNKYILRESMRSLLPDSIANRRNKIGFTTPEHEWFLHMKNKIYSLFLSESFANRSYVNQSAVLQSFRAFIEGKNDDTMIFWRLMNLELWMREFFDEIQDSEESVNKEKSTFEPNEGKKLEIHVDDAMYIRFTIRTSLFAKGDDFSSKISEHIAVFRKEIQNNFQYKEHISQPWIVIVSEKVVAISQGRSYFIWDINAGFWAKLLSKYVTRTPFGIGLGSPWTMQIAINEIGLIRILFATIVSAITKLFGIKGIFYKLVGRTVASIDGPTEYSLYPSNVSAKLGPKNPLESATHISESIKKTLSNEEQVYFQGAVIIDANDIGRDILGNATSIPDEIIASMMRDNPMGQSNEQTPLVVAIKRE